jgi:hypothetical protein
VHSCPCKRRKRPTLTSTTASLRMSTRGRRGSTTWTTGYRPSPRRSSHSTMSTQQCVLCRPLNSQRCRPRLSHTRISLSSLTRHPIRTLWICRSTSQSSPVCSWRRNCSTTDWWIPRTILET